jgi:hypothetical protein
MYTTSFGIFSLFLSWFSVYWPYVRSDYFDMLVYMFSISKKHTLVYFCNFCSLQELLMLYVYCSAGTCVMSALNIFDNCYSGALFQLINGLTGVFDLCNFYCGVGYLYECIFPCGFIWYVTLFCCLFHGFWQRCVRLLLITCVCFMLSGSVVLGYCWLLVNLLFCVKLFTFYNYCSWTLSIVLFVFKTCVSGDRFLFLSLDGTYWAQSIDLVLISRHQHQHRRRSHVIADGQSVSVSRYRAHSGTCDLILLSVQRLLSESCYLVSVARPLWREVGGHLSFCL